VVVVVQKVRWLINAYHASGEIVAYVWDKRDLRTAQALRKKTY
jgi:YD repeat-containing protein